MAIYIVRMDHPDGSGWDEHVVAHVRYLKGLIDQGKLVASGPLKGRSLRSGFLVMRGSDRDEIERLIADDPFAIEGLVCNLEIAEWDPLFGALGHLSSGDVPEAIASIFSNSDLDPLGQV